MTNLDTVLCFVPLCSTWDRLIGKLFATRDRNNFKLSVQYGSIRWQLRRQGIDEVMAKLGKVLVFSPLGIDLTASCSRLEIGTAES